jgi:hypothetical protein
MLFFTMFFFFGLLSSIVSKSSDDATFHSTELEASIPFTDSNLSIESSSTVDSRQFTSPEMLEARSCPTPPRSKNFKRLDGSRAVAKHSVNQPKVTEPSKSVSDNSKSPDEPPPPTGDNTKGLLLILGILFSLVVIYVITSFIYYQKGKSLMN